MREKRQRSPFLILVLPITNYVATSLDSKRGCFWNLFSAARRQVSFCARTHFRVSQTSVAFGLWRFLQDLPGGSALTGFRKGVTVLSNYTD